MLWKRQTIGGAYSGVSIMVANILKLFRVSTIICIFKLLRGKVLPDMLFRELFTASNPKNLFGNHDWYIEWLGTVDCL
jgi:hypothetical protein